MVASYVILAIANWKETPTLKLYLILGGSETQNIQERIEPAKSKTVATVATLGDVLMDWKWQEAIEKTV